MLALVAAIFAAIPPHYTPSLLDARVIAVNAMIVAIAALGMTLVMISGGIDLSVGSSVALAGVVAALVMKSGANPALAVLAAIGVGALCGTYNGALIVGFRIPPFIATLGTLGFFRGVAKWISSSGMVVASPRGLEKLAEPIPSQRWLVFAPGAWVMLALACAMGVLLRTTTFGLRATAIGSNQEAARRAGVPVGATKIAVYTVSGLFIGIAGVMQYARLQLGDPTVAVGLELDVIAAVVIGGASLSGGHASVVGAVGGAVLMAFLRNRCTTLFWPQYVQDMIVGHIIIIAVALDQWRTRRGSVTR
jgi:ribose transport system permease protein